MTGENLTANAGDPFIILDGMMGNLKIDGATNFSGQNDKALTGSGGDPNGSGTDLIRFGMRPEWQAALNAAGWINTGDRTCPSPRPVLDISPALRTAGVMEVSV